jgi:trigger factor
MQVTETSSEGLQRKLKVVVPAGDIGAKFSERMEDFRGQVQLKGFRRGKVPTAHLKKIYGRSLMAEVLQSTLDETTRKALADRNERPAVQPKIDLPESQDEIEKVLNGEADLAFDMSFEVLPQITLVDFATLKLEKLTADVPESEVDKAIDDLAERNTGYEPEEGRAAAKSDQVTIDFVGRIDGEAFEGGKGEDVKLVLGQGGFIPGFEDGLIGAKAGDHKVVKASFPAEYPVPTLAGKEAEFETTVKAVAKPVKPAIDDAFAKNIGATDLAQLRVLVQGQLQREHEQASRSKLKRALLDELEKAHDFVLPQSLVDGEFEGIWRQVTQGLERQNKTFADEGKTEESAREEFRKLAERRVRLGLVIGEIGEKNKVSVTEEELRRALIERARRYPGQERFVYEYFEKTPGAVDELRAPIFEDKVVDHIVDLAKPTERKVTREELLKPLEDETA